MNGFKELIFEFNSDCIRVNDVDSAIVKINARTTSYQPFYFPVGRRKEAGKIWTTKTDPYLFDDLTENIVHALYVKMPIAKDSTGIHITAIKDDGKKETQHVPISFKCMGLGYIYDLLVKILDGIILPAVICETEEE